MPQFIPDDIEDKELWIRLVYDIRSKIAHGDYKGIQIKTDKYIDAFLGHAEFDFYEHSKINWAYSGIYGTIHTVVANIIWSMLNIKPLITNIKEKKYEKMVAD